MSYIGQWYIPYKMHLDFWGSLLWFCLLCRNAFHKQSHSLDADSATCAADSTEGIIKTQPESICWKNCAITGLHKAYFSACFNIRTRTR